MCRSTETFYSCVANVVAIAILLSIHLQHISFDCVATFVINSTLKFDFSFFLPFHDYEIKRMIQIHRGRKFAFNTRKKKRSLLSSFSSSYVPNAYNAQATRFMETSKIKPNTFRTEISHLDWPFVFAAIATIILYCTNYFLFYHCCAIAVSVAAVFRMRCGFFVPCFNLRV